MNFSASFFWKCLYLCKGKHKVMHQMTVQNYFHSRFSVLMSSYFIFKVQVLLCLLVMPLRFLSKGPNARSKRWGGKYSRILLEIYASIRQTTSLCLLACIQMIKLHYYYTDFIKTFLNWTESAYKISLLVVSPAIFLYCRAFTSFHIIKSASSNERHTEW